MQCPACREELLIVEYEGVELDVCTRCDGFWFDADELDILLTLHGLPGPRPEKALAEAPAGRRARRRCPRCRRRMREIVRPGSPGPVTLDRCPRGDGLWFDRGELPRLLAVDVPDGDPSLRSIRDFLGRFAEPARGAEG